MDDDFILTPLKTSALNSLFVARVIVSALMNDLVETEGGPGAFPGRCCGPESAGKREKPIGWLVE
jgi:hypothetical protein